MFYNILLLYSVIKVKKKKKFYVLVIIILITNVVFKIFLFNLKSPLRSDKVYPPNHSYQICTAFQTTHTVAVSKPSERCILTVIWGMVSTYNAKNALSVNN